MCVNWDENICVCHIVQVFTHLNNYLICLIGFRKHRNHLCKCRLLVSRWQKLSIFNQQLRNEVSVVKFLLHYSLSVYPPKFTGKCRFYRIRNFDFLSVRICFRNILWPIFRLVSCGCTYSGMDNQPKLNPDMGDGFGFHAKASDKKAKNNILTD